jgi:hypothetical protein
MTDLRDQLPADTAGAPLSKLSQTAIELAGRIRDYHPDDNAAWLARVLPDPGDWFRLAFVLAAALPDDRSWRELTEWTRRPLPPKPHEATPAEPARHRVRRRGRPLKPCGTFAAVKRHRSNHEPLCEPCREAEREFERQKREARRTAA